MKKNDLVRFIYNVREKLSKASSKLFSNWRRKTSSRPEINNIVDAFTYDPCHAESAYRKYNDLLSKNGVKVNGKTVNDYYFREPLNPKQIILVGLGKNVRGNMQSILKVLNGDDRFSDFKIYVRTSPDTDSSVQGFIRDNHWNRTYTVPKTSDFHRILETSKYLMTEVYFTDAWVKKPGQIYINIWHGTPLKRIGLDKNYRNAHKNGTAQRNFIDADYLLYPNDYTCEKLLNAYKVSELMDGHALMLGYPRTGGMLAASSSDDRNIRAKLAPNGERLYAFMPTFRDYLNAEDSTAMIRELLDFLDAGFSDDQILYVNLHHKAQGSVDYSQYHRIRPFPPDLDSYQLLALTDALISDYSSVIFDYLALRRQIILYVPDYKEYRSKRGMFMELTDLPFDRAVTPDQVLKAINRGKQYDDRETYKKYCAYDSEENADKICQLFVDDESGLTIREIPKNGLPKVLIHSEMMEKGKTTKILETFTHIFKKESYEIYLSCNKDELKERESDAYPMCFDTPVIGSERNYRLSGAGKEIRELYLNGELSFKDAIDYLKYEYALVPKRMFGCAHFDVVIIYDFDDPERLISLSESGSIILTFLQENMIDRLISGDTFLMDAVRYASHYSSCICVTSEDLRKKAAEFIEEQDQSRLYVISCAEQIDFMIERVLEIKDEKSNYVRDF